MHTFVFVCVCVIEGENGRASCSISSTVSRCAVTEQLPGANEHHCVSIWSDQTSAL